MVYSGDTALQDEFADIGARLGPEQAVLAHRLVRGDVMLPVYWGLFDLALHAWTEPMERGLVAADSQGVRVASPRPGDMVEPASPAPPTRWWPRIPWKTAAAAPAWSSGVGRLLGRGGPRFPDGARPAQPAQPAPFIRAKISSKAACAAAARGCAVP